MDPSLYGLVALLLPARPSWVPSPAELCGWAPLLLVTLGVVLVAERKQITLRGLPAVALVIAATLALYAGRPQAAIGLYLLTLGALAWAKGWLS